MIPEAAQKDFYQGLKSEWRKMPWTVLSVVLLWTIIMAVYFLIYPQLAKATDFKDLNNRLSSVEIRLLDQQILSTKALSCKSPNKRYFTERLTELLRQYAELTRTGYPLPDCTQVD